MSAGLQLVALLCLAQSLSGQDISEGILNQAYDQLRSKDYESAVKSFRRVLEVDPTRVAVNRELGYTLLKMGETEQAVEAFEAYARARPDDFQNILELAYLYYQTKRPAKALEFFGRGREAPSEALAAQARKGYQTVEQPMLWEIARWRRAVDADPSNVDAHEALGEAYAHHREIEKAIEQYRELRRQAPSRFRHLVTLAELYEKLGEQGGSGGAAGAYYLLAWRSPDPRIAARGRQGLGNRYPYASEFEMALELEPEQHEVRKELGYLYIEIKRPEAAARHFELAVRGDPQDYQSLAQLGFLYAGMGRNEDARLALERVLRRGPPELAGKVGAVLSRLSPPSQPAEPAAPPPEDIQSKIIRHRELGFLNARKSYLEAAVREFEEVVRLDPRDYTAILELGRLYNTLKNDEAAIRWFKLARSSPDRKQAAEARRAVQNLSEPNRKVINTTWAMPFLSSRFQATFGYGQVKSELRLKSLPFRPYLSMRFVGDSRTRTGGSQPQVFSDDGVILGVGLIGRLARNLWAWGEAGNALTALNQRPTGLQRSEPDYRGGLAFGRIWGPSLFQQKTGRFVDASGDAVYLSRFGQNAVFYAQTKTGYQLASHKGFHHQPFVAANLFADARGDYFNNLMEFGPGYRFGYDRFKNVNVCVVYLRGVYTTEGRRTKNFRGPNYNDLRLVVWYSRSF